jgi:hypothetical protein
VQASRRASVGKEDQSDAPTAATLMRATEPSVETVTADHLENPEAPLLASLS